ncbi:MAG: hypothetical protein QMD53_04050 [Actinomycetota bacterium]|nr:hypothetical protein [Actinomycetota bacterium]
MVDEQSISKGDLQKRLDEIGKEVSKKVKESDAARTSLITVILMAFLEMTLFAYFLGKRKGKKVCKKKSK